MLPQLGIQAGIQLGPQIDQKLRNLNHFNPGGTKIYRASRLIDKYWPVPAILVWCGYNIQWHLYINPNGSAISWLDCLVCWSNPSTWGEFIVIKNCIHDCRTCRTLLLPPYSSPSPATTTTMSKSSPQFTETASQAYIGLTDLRPPQPPTQVFLQPEWYINREPKLSSSSFSSHSETNNTSLL